MGFEWPVGRGRSVRPSAIAALTGRKFDRRSGAHFRFSFKQHWSRLYSSTTDMQEQAKARLRESRHLTFSGLRNLDFAFSSMSVNKISFEVHRLPPDFTTKDVTPMRGCICSIPLPDPARRPLQCTADLIPDPGHSIGIWSLLMAIAETCQQRGGRGRRLASRIAYNPPRSLANS